MKKYIFDSIKTIFVLFFVTILISKIEIFPWWSFLFTAILIGFVITLKQWDISTFWIGFLSGFVIWFGANYYYDITSNGIILNKVGDLISLPKLIVLLVSGIIGGICTGLALYVGKSFFNLKKN